MSSKFALALAGALLISACGDRPPEAQAPVVAEAPKAEEPVHHEHHAPHGGSLVVFGDEFGHLELVLDTAAGRLTAYALDGEAENPVRLAMKSIEIEARVGEKSISISLALAPVANPLTGEEVGNTSQFEAVSEKLKSHPRFLGEVKLLEMKGSRFEETPFRYPEGNEEEEEHDR